MRIRTRTIGAALAAAAMLMAWSSRAAADPPSAAPPPSAGLISIDAFFGRSSLLGDAWQKAVTAALDSMKRAAELERTAAERALEERGRRAPEPIPWQRTVGFVRGAGSDARLTLKLEPVIVDPPSEAGIDARGQRAALLGVQLTLPWMVP